MAFSPKCYLCEKNTFLTIADSARSFALPRSMSDSAARSGCARHTQLAWIL